MHSDQESETASCVSPGPGCIVTGAFQSTQNNEAVGQVPVGEPILLFNEPIAVWLRAEWGRGGEAPDSP